MNTSDPPSVHIQLFPHSEVPLSQTLSRYNRHFMFKPIEKLLGHGITLKMGRKIDAKKETTSMRWSRDEQIANNASVTVVGQGTAAQSQIPGTPVQTASMFPDQTSSPESGFVLDASKQKLQPQETLTVKRQELISFRSKVVSRTHAELWMGRDGQVFLTWLTLCRSTLEMLDRPLARF